MFKKDKIFSSLLLQTLVLLPVTVGTAHAQDAVDQSTTTKGNESRGPEIFLPEWYEGYNARTVYDMVAATPGIAFVLEGEDTSQRGLGAQENLLLVNGKPLTGKPVMRSSSLALEVLGSMKSSELERVEVYRAGSDKFQKKTDQLIVNVVLKDEGISVNSDWSVRLWRLEGSTIKPTFFFNTTRRKGERYFNVSGSIYRAQSYTHTQNHEFDKNRVASSNFDRDYRLNNDGMRIGFRWARPFAGDGTFNLEGTTRGRVYTGIQNEFSWDGPGVGQGIADDASLEISNFKRKALWGILNLNINKPLSEKWRLKFVAIQSFDTQTSENIYAYDGEDPNEQIDFDNTVGESIARTTFFYQRSDKQQLRFGGEMAYNFRDQYQAQYLANEIGDLDLVSLDNSTAFVDEWRGEAFAYYNWRPSKEFFIEVGNVLELSQISQTSDNLSQSRRLIYTKPFLQSTYEITDSSRLSLKLEREVGQLDFAQFISSVNKDDDKIDGGNPDLAPIQTWNLSGQIEHTLGNKAGTVRLKLFHLWDTDVPERILGADGNGAAGNIGSGKRYGAEVSASLRLDNIGIKDAKLDGSFTYEDGNVIDPFIFTNRFYSKRPHSMANISFSQTLKKYGITYGGDIDWRSGWSVHDAETVEFYRYGSPQLNLNAEKKFQNGMALGIQLENILNKRQRREKTFYTFDRGFIDGFQSRFVQNGMNIKVVIKGNF